MADILNPKQARFCSEFMVDLNATKAAGRAGYASVGSLMTNPLVVDRIQEMAADRAKAVGLDAEWVIGRLMTLVDRCMEAEPVMEWVDGEQRPSGVYRFDSSGATKGLDLLGKHLRLFASKVEVDISDSLAERLGRARSRIKSVESTATPQIIEQTPHIE